MECILVQVVQQYQKHNRNRGREQIVLSLFHAVIYFIAFMIKIIFKIFLKRNYRYLTVLQYLDKINMESSHVVLHDA